MCRSKLVNLAETEHVPSFGAERSSNTLRVESVCQKSIKTARWLGISSWRCLICIERDVLFISSQLRRWTWSFLFPFEKGIAIMSLKSSSYLPLNGAAEAAREKAAKAILAMSDEYFPAHHADADEAPDPVTLVGYSTATHGVDFLVPVEPDVCLGFMCPMKSDVCDRCGLSEDVLLEYEIG